MLRNELIWLTSSRSIRMNDVIRLIKTKSNLSAHYKRSDNNYEIETLENRFVIFDFLINISNVPVGSNH